MENKKISHTHTIIIYILSSQNNADTGKDVLFIFRTDVSACARFTHSALSSLGDNPYILDVACGSGRLTAQVSIHQHHTYQILSTEMRGTLSFPVWRGSSSASSTA